MAYGLLVCPVCGKKFVCGDVKQWVYKLTVTKPKHRQKEGESKSETQVCCSYTCYNKAMEKKPRGNYIRVK